MNNFIVIVASLVVLTGASTLATAAPKSAGAPAPKASAELKSADGKDVGKAALTQTRSGVRIRLSLNGLPPGEHAFHVHAVGKCEAPFTSAGPHFNPGQKKHGLNSPEGHHAGDMRNIVIPASGKLTLADVLHRDPDNPKTVTSAEDYVVQVGQGDPWDRTEHLGKMDVGVILIRQLWRRELLALSEGRALRAWASERLGSQAAGSVQGMPSRSSSAS